VRFAGGAAFPLGFVGLVDGVGALTAGGDVGALTPWVGIDGGFGAVTVLGIVTVLGAGAGAVTGGFGVSCAERQTDHANSGAIRKVVTRRLFVFMIYPYSTSVNLPFTNVTLTLLY
jgi:hypothetical protein